MPKTKQAGERINKSAWIRNQPTAMSAKDLLQKAKREGIHLTLAQVYTARSTAKARGRGPAEAAHPAPSAPRRAQAASGPSSGVSNMQTQFLSLVVRLGTDHAQRLLRSLTA